MTANHNRNIKAALAAECEREGERPGEQRATNGHGHYEPISAQRCVYATFSYGQLMSLFAEVVGLWPALAWSGPGRNGAFSLRMLLLSPEHDISH